MEGLHPHCLKCINRRCMVRPEPGVSCDLLGCPLVCGAVFHACKLDEHRLLCPYERLPCLNSGFGCPFDVPRKKMAKHLQTCPASVVCCTMEWNRWPVSYADRKSYENLSRDCDEVEQLDMALALQDQRMLLESLKVATTTSSWSGKGGGWGMGSAGGPVEMEEETYEDLEASRSLDATLDGEKSVEMLDSDSEGELGAVGGAAEEDPLSWDDDSNFVEICFQDRQRPIVDPGLLWPRISRDLLPAAYPALVPPPSLLLAQQVQSDLLHPVPSWLRSTRLGRKLASADMLGSLSMFTLNGRRALPSDPYLFRAKMEDKAVDTSDLEVPDDPMGLHGIDLTTAALLFCLGDSPGGRGISDSRFVDGYHIDFGTQTFSFPSAILATSTMVGDVASASACDHASPQLSNPSPFHTLRLDLVLECVARYQTKQRSMFTFVCGQLFRRDEFPSHFKNVHGDIHAGLNGWMEQRCPLAYYGCTYSQRRFCPSAHGYRIIHDRHLGSFGVRPPRRGRRRRGGAGGGGDQLSRLPFEVLQHVASFLDGFSLCQLSRVSRTMREVCGSLLQMRGMVVLLWNKTRRHDGATCWQITDKVWRFSTAFGTVNEWKFTDMSSMADHLKSCRFNTVARREEAVPLPCMCFTRELTRGGRSLRSVLKPVA